MSSAFSDSINMHRFEPGNLPNDIVTEDSAALEFVDRHCGVLRYCHSTGAWYRWNGVYWAQDRTAVAFQWARELARQLGQDQEKKSRYITSKVSFASGVERFAKSDQRIAVTIEYWDSDRWLLGTPGGTVDLRTGELRESLQDDGITKCIPRRPTPQAVRAGFNSLKRRPPAIGN
jgi:putative DNA primase/helicase